MCERLIRDRALLRCAIGEFDALAHALPIGHSGRVRDPSPIMLNPVTVIEFNEDWTIALNRNQNLLGKTMLVLNRPCGSVTDLTTDEWVGLHRQIRRVCTALDALFAPDLYNHAFLMNQDRHVHLHVVPRYRADRSWSGETFTDPHWGAQFGGEERLLTDEDLTALADEVRAGLPRS